MAALRSRCGRYIFALWFLLSSFFFLKKFPRLISTVADWMSTILPHMVWPLCEFRIRILGLKRAARGSPNRQKFAICATSHNFVGPYLRN